MDDLSRAVAQFYPSSSGGMSGGSSTPPPGPSDYSGVLSSSIEEKDRHHGEEGAASAINHNRINHRLLYLSQKQQQELSSIQDLAYSGVKDYIRKFEHSILDEFPKAGHIIHSKTFVDTLVQELIKDAGYRPGLNLTFLRKVHENLEGIFELVTDNDYKSNDIYSNIVLLLKYYR